MTDNELEYLKEASVRAVETRQTWFGKQRTNRAEAARAVLVAYAPALIREIERLKS